MEAIENAEHDDQGHRGYRHTYDGDGAYHVDGMGALAGEEVATGDEEGEIHCLFLQQLIDMLQVVETVVEEETQLGDYPQLIAHLGT